MHVLMKFQKFFGDLPAGTYHPRVYKENIAFKHLKLQELHWKRMFWDIRAPKIFMKIGLQKLFAIHHLKLGKKTS